MPSENERPDLAANLETLDKLLGTLAEVLDINEVFERISSVTQQVLPHDVMGVLEASDDGERVHLRVTAGLPQDIAPSFDGPAHDPALFRSAWDAFIIDDLQAHPLGRIGPAAKAGMKTALCAPVRFGGQVQAAVNFFSSQPGRFSPDDVLIAKRIASHIAVAMSHHRLAMEVNKRQMLEARAASLDVLDQSLQVLTEGPLRELFDRISAMARPVLPHDAVVLSVLLPDGRHARGYVASGLDVTSLPPVMEVPARNPGWDYEIAEDLRERTEAVDVLATRLGFRSALRLPVALETRFVGALTFLSRTPAFYQPGHVPMARRVASRVALSLERELGVESARRADEANERAARLEARVRQLSDELDARTGYRRVIGESPTWRQVLTQAAQVAATETTVLLLGESGTGKEVVARFIHRASGRQNGPFVALNCAALPEHLLEAELFGFERGAFTGATQTKPGQVEQAAGGVLFLDEVGEMTLPAQAKLLRVLQEREFQRLGGNRVIRADVRVVAATNRDLAKAIDRGTFREDLFYRLNVFAIHLPPLRDRRDDILPMTEVFMNEIGRTLGRPPAGLTRDARQALMDYHWPGNVRELRKVIERAAILADGGLIVREHLALAPPAPMAAGTATGPIASANSSMTEREAIERALQDARFNKVKAAKALGLTRGQLYVRLKRHGLE